VDLPGDCDRRDQTVHDFRSTWDARDLAGGLDLTSDAADRTDDYGRRVEQVRDFHSTWDGRDSAGDLGLTTCAAGLLDDSDRPDQTVRDSRSTWCDRDLVAGRDLPTDAAGRTRGCDRQDGMVHGCRSTWDDLDRWDRLDGMGRDLASIYWAAANRALSRTVWNARSETLRGLAPPNDWVMEDGLGAVRVCGVRHDSRREPGDAARRAPGG
jgi:hypothetical protein